MTVLFEAQYCDQRYAGLGLPLVGKPLTLHAVDSDQIRSAISEGAGLSAIENSVRSSPGIVVASGDPNIRFLPPLLPADGGESLVTGFMGTHRSKYPEPPRPDEPFVAPNWLIKGVGNWLEVNGAPLTVPHSPAALLEEPEVGLVFVNSDDGSPRYAGYTFGNDLNDIGLHLENPWGWTPYAKLCDTSMLPWLFLGPPPARVAGQILIERGGSIAWKGDFTCGSDALFQRVPDLVNHLFSYPPLRRPGLVNYVLLGSDKASWHDGFRITNGDRIIFEISSHGVVMSNEVAFAPHPAEVLAELELGPHEPARTLSR